MHCNDQKNNDLFHNETLFISEPVEVVLVPYIFSPPPPRHPCNMTLPCLTFSLSRGGAQMGDIFVDILCYAQST